jgi:hypothetical protein
MVPSQEQHDESLKERIRLRFYRGMFSEPEVRIRHPELRAGEAYRLDEKISTGQQNAVMLMLVCTENLIRVDDVMESPKLAE